MCAENDDDVKTTRCRFMLSRVLLLLLLSYSCYFNISLSYKQTRLQIYRPRGVPSVYGVFAYDNNIIRIRVHTRADDGCRTGRKRDAFYVLCHGNSGRQTAISHCTRRAHPYTHLGCARGDRKSRVRPSSPFLQ